MKQRVEIGLPKVDPDGRHRKRYKQALRESLLLEIGWYRPDWVPIQKQ